MTMRLDDNPELGFFKIDLFSRPFVAPFVLTIEKDGPRHWWIRVADVNGATAADGWINLECAVESAELILDLCNAKDN